MTDMEKKIKDFECVVVEFEERIIDFDDSTPDEKHYMKLFMGFKKAINDPCGMSFTQIEEATKNAVWFGSTCEKSSKK